MLGAGQHDPVGARQLFRTARPAQLHAAQLAQRLELVEVADARVGHDGDAQAGRGIDGAALPAGALVVQAVFLGQSVAAPHRQHREGRHAGQRQQLLRPRLEQPRVAAEAVQHIAPQQCPLRRRQQLVRAVEVGERAATVDVAHQQAGGPRRLRGAHVDVVAGVQVDLGRRAGALDHHHVVLGHQRQQRVLRERPQPLAALAPRHGREVGTHLAQHDDLAAGVVLGLQQHRVHAHVGQHPGGQRLEVLRAADLAEPAPAARHHARVVAHVLRLEGRDLQALARVPAAQRRRQPALAGPAGGAEHHDGPRGRSCASVHRLRAPRRRAGGAR
ncbi:hypothetical protein X551_04720 [Methylibium sp. T29]|nr:hypothetical protein X551_04720 [Methylibium sp. T29]